MVWRASSFLNSVSKLSSSVELLCLKVYKLNGSKRQSAEALRIGIVISLVMFT